MPKALLSLAVVLALGALSFAALGLGISGFVRSAEGSSAVINAVYLPMAIISGTFFTPKGYPGFLKAISDALPLTHYTKLTRDVMLHNEPFWHDVSALAMVVLWGVRLSAYLFRRTRSMIASYVANLDGASDEATTGISNAPGTRTTSISATSPSKVTAYPPTVSGRETSARVKVSRCVR